MHLRTIRHRPRLVVALFGLAALASAGTVHAKEAPPSPAQEDAKPVWIGIELVAKDGGVYVKRVMADSPGEAAHLREGDRVLSVGGQALSDPDQLIRRVQAEQPGKTLVLSVRSAHATKPHEVRVTLAPRPEPRDYQRKLLLGRPAPDFRSTAVTGGKPLQLSSLHGKVVLIDFFASWCGPCMDALPHVEELYDTLGSKGLMVLGVSDEGPDTVREVVEKHKLRYHVVSDEGEDISSRYGVYALPTMVIIDRQGVVREVSIADVGLTLRTVRELVAAGDGSAH